MNRTLITVTIILLITSCGEGSRSADIPVISVSILPQQYFIERIAGDRVKVNVMIPPGASPATYDPTVSQLSKLDRSCLYLRIGYLGFELGWSDRIRSVNPSMKVVDLSTGIELIGETEEQTLHGHSHGSVDPHLWMSSINAKIIARNIYNEMLLLLPDEKDILTLNLRILEQDLDSLHRSITDMLSMKHNRSFMIYHPALTYFAREFNLNQYALETGGKTPSPAQMKRMSDLGKAEGISTIFIQRQFDRKNAEALAREIDAEIVQINPLDPDWYNQMLYIAKKLQMTL